MRVSNPDCSPLTILSKALTERVHERNVNDNANEEVKHESRDKSSIGRSETRRGIYQDREHSNRLCPSWLVWKPVGNTRRVGSRRRRLGVYHASRTLRQQTQSRPDEANPGTAEDPWEVAEKSEGNAGS